MYWREILAQSIVFFIVISFVSAVIMCKISEIDCDAINADNTDEM